MVPTMAHIAVTEPYIFLAYVIVPTTAHQHLKELQLSLNATILFISNVWACAGIALWSSVGCKTLMWSVLIHMMDTGFYLEFKWS